jgi:hypothetical protein
VPGQHFGGVVVTDQQHVLDDPLQRNRADGGHLSGIGGGIITDRPGPHDDAAAGEHVDEGGRGGDGGVIGPLAPARAGSSSVKGQRGHRSDDARWHVVRPPVRTHGRSGEHAVIHDEFHGAGARFRQLSGGEVGQGGQLGTAGSVRVGGQHRVPTTDENQLTWSVTGDYPRGEPVLGTQHVQCGCCGQDLHGTGRDQGGICVGREELRARGQVDHRDRHAVSQRIGAERTLEHVGQWRSRGDRSARRRRQDSGHRGRRRGLVRRHTRG